MEDFLLKKYELEPRKVSLNKVLSEVEEHYSQKDKEGLVEHLKDLHSKGYEFEYVLLDEKTSGGMKVWFTQITLGLYAVKGRKRNLVFKTVIEDHYVNGVLKEFRKYIKVEDSR